MNLSHRLRSLQSSLLAQSLDGLIVSQRDNLRYLAHVDQLHPTHREALLFVTPQTAVLYHSPFLIPLPHPGIKLMPMDSNHPPAKILPQIFSGRIGIEATNYTVAELEKLKSFLPQSEIIPTTDLVETLRLIKDPDELKLMRRAGSITAKLMSWALALLQGTSTPGVKAVPTPGVNITEIDLAHQIECKAYALGADGLAFPSVVAFGKHTAFPHHQPGKAKLSAGPVLIDLGVQYHGYCSDMTRTIFLGSLPSQSPLSGPPRFRAIASVVNKAYSAALTLLTKHYQVSVLTEKFLPRGESSSLLGGEISTLSVDLAARSVIEKEGYGKNFIHTSGHGLGLEIHEAPSINSQNQMLLKSGMAITLEPGIYLPNLYGFRHENTLLLS
jgi:Xaa-Pro aminopeptidase